MGCTSQSAELHKQMHRNVSIDTSNSADECLNDDMGWSEIRRVLLD